MNKNLRDQFLVRAKCWSFLILNAVFCIICIFICLWCPYCGNVYKYGSCYGFFLQQVSFPFVYLFLLLLSAPPLYRNGVGVQQSCLRTPAHGIPHQTEIRARWLTGGPLQSTSRCPASTGAVHKSATCSCVFMLVQLNKCVVVCGSDLQTGHSGDGCLTSSILVKYERSMGTFVCSELGQGTTGWSGECCFRVMYCEFQWYGVCRFVVLSVVKVCADYGGVNVHHVCLNFGIVYDVGVCVNVYGVHQTDTACAWLVCHSQEGLCKLYPSYPVSLEARAPSFFGSHGGAPVPCGRH